MSYKYLVLLLSTFIIIISCNKYAGKNGLYKKKAGEYANTLKQQPQDIPVDSAAAPVWVGTTNFNMRKPNFVIIHHTAQNSCDETLKTFTLERTQVSAHYVICRNGVVHHMLNDYLRAWHGGIAKWGNITDLNSVSIGIELDNNGFEPFSSLQINSLLTLLDTQKKK
jgi:N-acetylmuramoyl-L-alanine amidase